MKHAIMVMGYGKTANVLQNTINILDDYDIDFFVHWDKKYRIPKLTSKQSNIIFVPSIRVKWGTDTQITAERILMDNVMNYKSKYDYVHLISSNDIPLMTVSYFKHYFKPGSYYIGFMNEVDSSTLTRIKYYYPIRHWNVKNKLFTKVVLKIIKLINVMLHINRISNTDIQKGCNWFSMDIKFVHRILEYKKMDIFMNTFCGDEFYVQTILHDLKINGSMSDNDMALRYIDWNRGNPYVFTTKDVHELSKLKNTHYAFARKLNDAEIVKKVFDDK